MSVVAAPVRTYGGSAGGMIDYALRRGRFEHEHEPPAAIFRWGVTSAEAAAREMDALAGASRCKTPTVSIVLSWEAGEHPTADQAQEAAEIAMRGLGLDGCQAVAALHRDTDNDHLHLIVNRVDRTGRARSLWQSDNRLYVATREIEREQGWTRMPERELSQSRSEKHYERWAGRPALERDLAASVLPAIDALLARPGAAWRDLHGLLALHDLRYVASTYGGRSGGRIERIDTPGSGAGAKRVLGLSHRDLEARLGAYHPDYIGGRAFAARVHSATLAVLAARTEGGSWEQVHGIMADHGLRYERYGGGARISDEKSNATMKAADADRRLRKGEMEKCFGRMIDGERTELLRAAREAARIAQEIVTAERMKNDPSDLLRGLVAHDSTFARDDVERAVATRIVNVGARDAIVEAALRHCVVLGSDDAYETRYSLPEVVRDERALRDAAELMATRGSGPRIERTASEHLDAQQRHAYDYATSGRDLSLITGVPGAGKTTLVRDIAAAYREAGYTVRAVAVANAACDVLLRETDLPARNVAKELYEWGEGRAQLTNRDVLIIDEVSMLGSDQGARLLDAAARAGAKVIALGDDRQLAAVGRGDTLRAMADALGEQRVDLQTTRRQQIAWQREATHAMRAGNIEAGLAAYRDHGNVIATTTREEAARELVARYDVARELGKDAALMAYRNADVKLLNDLARDGARARGELVGPDVLMQTDFGERAFARGERVVVRQTILVDGGGRWTNGQTAIVRGIDGTTLALQRERDGAQLGVDLTEHDRIDHAYAATKHREQGTTHELAFTLAARPDDARSTLVAMTRHVEDAVLAYAREDIPDFATLVARAARFDEKEMTTDYRLIREPMLEHTLDPVRDGQERGPTWTMEREQEIGQHEREIEHEPREIEREYVQEVEHGRDFGIDF